MGEENMRANEVINRDDVPVYLASQPSAPRNNFFCRTRISLSAPRASICYRLFSSFEIR
jgi:hypothetical protein